MAEPEAPDRAEKIAGYKTLLRSVIERRPSGLRGRLAMALGKHKSFVSQITNPSYTVPIPATDLTTIFEICHLAPAEREQFLALYREAHPERAQRPPPAQRAARAAHRLAPVRDGGDGARCRGPDPGLRRAPSGSPNAPKKVPNDTDKRRKR